MKNFSHTDLTKSNVYLFSKFLNGRETTETTLRDCVEAALMEYEQYLQTLFNSVEVRRD